MRIAGAGGCLQERKGIEMKHCYWLFALTLLLTGGCARESTGQADASGGAATPVAGDSEMTDTQNPLLAEWHTPFGVPPFDQIEDTHYLPALRAGMKARKDEVEEIARNSEAPSFENTVEALERSGSALTRVRNVFYAVNSAHSNDQIRETAAQVAPELAALYDDIYLDRGLFERVKKVYEARETLNLDAEQGWLLSETYKDFKRAGANLDPDAQARLREINAELATLSQDFRDNLLEERKGFELLVSDRADLGELSDGIVAAAAAEAKRRGHECECWVFTLQRTSINPFLAYSPNRELRKKIFMGYAQRGDNGNEFDNRSILVRTAELRAERAKLLGYPSHAHYKLEDNVAETPERVYRLLDKVWPPALAKAKDERGELQKMMSQDGIDDQLRAWDWRYYTERLRKARYDLDAERLRAYFELTAVRDGVFTVAKRLFGISFVPRDDLPKWHSDQQVFEVRDEDGSHLAILYMDFFARESKRGGAWMNELREQSKLDGNVTPIVTNNFNFSAPTEESSALLNLSEARTLFHEFGHALNGMFSDVTYESMSGTGTPRDFVEFPSQVMENWMSEADVLRSFARHYQTGEPLPQEYIDKITATNKFNQGFQTVEYMAASYLDLEYHTMSEARSVDPRAFEEAAMKRIGLIDEIIPRYRSTYFSHIFAGGYSAGYYGYLWSEVMDADAFQAFKEAGLFDRATAARFREQVLSRGGSRPGLEMFEAFRGRPPAIEPLLARRGFLDESASDAVGGR